jgi:hypothetical protein
MVAKREIRDFVTADAAVRGPRRFLKDLLLSHPICRVVSDAISIEGACVFMCGEAKVVRSVEAALLDLTMQMDEVDLGDAKLLLGETSVQRMVSPSSVSLTQATPWGGL